MNPIHTHEQEVIIKVPFHDVDMMSVVWHGNYARYFEVARCALLDDVDYNYGEMLASGYAWPVIDMRIRFPRPAIFGQNVSVRARITEWEHRLKIDYLIRDQKTGQRLTTGYTIQVAVDMSTQQMCFESPNALWQKLGLHR